MKRVAVHLNGRRLWVAEVADNPWTRFWGLMGRKGLPPGYGMLIVPCRSVHTWFMRFPIDVVYLAKDGTVTAVHPNLGPFRFSFRGRGARMVLELPAGAAELAGLKPGQRLVIKPLE